jgi:hypothetical protein
MNRSNGSIGGGVNKISDDEAAFVKTFLQRRFFGSFF